MVLVRLVFVFRFARPRLLVSRGSGVVPGPDINGVTDFGTITGGKVGVSTLNCPKFRKNKHFEILVSCSDEERNCMQAQGTACKLK